MTAVIARPAFAGWTLEAPGPSDRDALDEMFARCSPLTVQLRFFGVRTDLPRAYVDAALAGVPERHDALVARQDGRVDALASLVTEPVTGSAELAVLVVDAAQRRGLGRALVQCLLERAAGRGVTCVTASVLPHRMALLQALERRVPVLEWVRSRDTVSAGFRLSPTEAHVR